MIHVGLALCALAVISGMVVLLYRLTEVLLDYVSPAATKETHYEPK